MEWVNLVLLSAAVVGGLTESAIAVSLCETGTPSCVDSLCSEVPRRLENVSSAIEQLATKLADKAYAHCSCVRNATYCALEQGFLTPKLFETQEKKLSDVESAVSGIRKELVEKNDIALQNLKSLKNYALERLSDREKILSDMGKLETKLEEGFNVLASNYESLEVSVTEISKMLRTTLETIAIQSNSLSNAVQSQTQKLAQQELFVLKGFEKQEANFETSLKAVADLRNTVAASNQKWSTSNTKSDQNDSHRHEIMERTKLDLNSLTNRNPPNTSRILDTSTSNESPVIRELVLYDIEGFVTNDRYSNVRMFTNVTDYFPSHIFPKDTDVRTAITSCQVFCVRNDSCQAFNFIAKQGSYVCEMLTDNMCLSQTRYALLNWPGSILWEKTNASTPKSCLEQKFPSGKEIPCEIVKPGCVGNWPQCSQCLQTCADDTPPLFGIKVRTLWPEGGGPFATPMFGHCFLHKTLIVRRQVNMETGKLTRDYLMSFQDMHRINRRLKDPTMEFYFFAFKSRTYYISYRNLTIGVTGTLSNMTFDASDDVNDFFNLNTTALQPTPFATVTDDRYGCGSFWLLDPNNATYCPGGQVSIFGEVRMKDGKVISTGMSIPESITANETIFSVYVSLTD